MIRIRYSLKATGFTGTAGEDDLTRIIGKKCPAEITRQVTKLRSDVNNMNSRTKSLLGSSIDHPQGGIITVADLPKVKKIVTLFKDAVAEISSELQKIIDDGTVADRIRQLGVRPNLPELSFDTVVATDDNDRAAVIAELGGLVTMVDVIPQQDEIFVRLLTNLARKMGEQHQKLLERIRKAKLDPDKEEPVTKEDIIKANNKFIHSMDEDRAKIRTILGPSQMKQIDDLLDGLLSSGKAMCDVFESCKLSNGNAISTCITDQTMAGIMATMNATDPDLDDLMI